MFRDVSEIENLSTNCIKINDDKSLTVYTNTDTSLYKLVSNKYYKIESFDPNTPQTGTNCYTVTQLQTLPSAYDFMTPVYHSMAIGTTFAIFFLAYVVVIKPFWRPR